MNILGYIFSVLLVTGTLLGLSGHLTVRCTEPNWFFHNYYCKATLVIPNR